MATIHTNSQIDICGAAKTDIRTEVLHEVSVKLRPFDLVGVPLPEVDAISTQSKVLLEPFRELVCTLDDGPVPVAWKLAPADDVKRKPDTLLVVWKAPVLTLPRPLLSTCVLSREHVNRKCTRPFPPLAQH